MNPTELLIFVFVEQTDVQMASPPVPLTLYLRNFKEQNNE
jgi:hypothetical protein